jgi:ABC-2 type transport system permease protein
MSTVSETAALAPVAPSRSIVGHLADIWAYRELLRQLIRKELKVRYRNSVLGFVWSMVNPLFLMLVYSIAFAVLGAGFAHFAIWLITGLLAWNFVNGALTASTTSITLNSPLVGKVRFPREILPLAATGAALVHLFLQLGVLFAVLAVLRHPVAWNYMWLIPIAIVAVIVLCASLGMLLGAVNVYARDTQHLLELALLAWFWLTPILYPFARVSSFLASHGLPTSLAFLNPVTPIVITFQRAIYGVASIHTATATQQLLPNASPLWYLRNLTAVVIASCVLFALALKLFDRAESGFAEVL